MKKSLLFMAAVLIFNVQPLFAEQLEFFKKLDTNKDNKISAEEFFQIKAERAQRAARFFEHFDNNKDGYLDQSEWEVAKEKINEKAKER